MSYWKLMANAAWAGAYGSLLLAGLLVLLNGAPNAGSTAWDLVRATLSLTPVYAPAIALLLTTGFVFLRFFAVRRLSARWQSFKAIVWFCAAALAGLTAAFYLNIRWVGSLLSPGTVDALRACSAVMASGTLAAILMASLAQIRSGREAARLRVAAAGALAAPLLALAFLAAGLPPRPSPMDSRLTESAWAKEAGRERLLLLAIDAATMDHLLPLVSAGELPNFDRLMRRGAAGRLNTLRPCESSVAWSALLSGRPPWATGRRDVAAHRLPFGPSGIDLLPRAVGMGLLRKVGYLSSTPWPDPLWSGRTVWDAARGAGLAAQAAGWEGSDSLDLRDPRVEGRMARILGDAAPGGDPAMDSLRRAVARDLAVRDNAMALEKTSPHLMAVRLGGLAAVSRAYLRYLRPEEFGDVPDAESERRGRALKGYYAFLDEILGEHLETGGEGRFVMVVSAHGVEPLPGWERLAHWARRGDKSLEVSGSWRRGPDGVFLLAGPGVQEGARPEEVDLLDIAPTAAYLMGLPIEGPMRGHLLRRLLRHDFLEAHPVHFVPAYEPGPLL